MRRAFAHIALVPGVGKRQLFKVPYLEEWQTEQAIDNDVDSFTVEIGDVANRLISAVDRDTEIRLGIFLSNARGKTEQIFSGIADVDSLVTGHTHQMQGGDVPSAILMGSDASPGYWRHVTPAKFLTSRGKALGLTNLKIAPMKEIGRLWADASEKEWAFWYRVARMGGCFMWSTATGTLIIDGLAYSKTSYKYSIGHPHRGESPHNWIPFEDVSLTSNKQQRVDKAIVYGEDKKKKGSVPIGIARNPHTASIAHWLRRPVSISTLTTAKTQKDLDDEAKLQIFESIVGAQEHIVTVRDEFTIEQNSMARVNIPEYGLVGRFYIAGVTRIGGPDGMTQAVRLREPGFAVDTRVPTAPTLSTQPNTGSGSTANIGQGLAQQGIRWYGAFVRAARESLSGPGTQGWDLSVALGVLLSICAQETANMFVNVRQGDLGQEWFPYPTTAPDPSLIPDDPWTGKPLFPDAPTLPQLQDYWRQAFANDASNPDNPLRPNPAGVGPMQLTTPLYKTWADDFGWSGVGKRGELDGGRWNPESNIRAGAKALAQKALAVGADPTNSGTIWAAVEAYNGSGAAAAAYRQKVKHYYDTTYGAIAAAAVAAASTSTTGQIQRIFRDSAGNVVLTLPDDTPDEVAKGITWAMGKRGDPYQWGGAGNPNYDCSSLVTEALVIGDGSLRSSLDEPKAPSGHHGETTFTLWDKGKPVSKDSLLPGDLVFFDGINHAGQLEPRGHVGMYLGEGQFINAPRTGEFVRIDALNDRYYASRFDGARRFFFWPTRGV